MFAAIYHQQCRYYRGLLLVLIAIASTGCGFHLRGTTQLPEKLQTLTLVSNDPYGPLLRDIREQLRLNNVKVVDDSQNVKISSLRIVNTSSGQDTVSVFQDGTTAEYQLALTVDAQVLVPGHDFYPIHIKIFRSFFDNPLTALAKDAEQSLILQEMYKDAAEQLMRKLLSVPTEDDAQPTITPAAADGKTHS